MSMRAIDCMGFAGGFDCGVEQAGFKVVAKREPAAFGGFGVAAVESNIPEVAVEVNESEFWSIVKADMVFGNPPCSGFSMLSTINTADSKTGKMVDGVRVDQRGVNSPDNKHMTDFVSYAAKVKPEIAIFESVRGGGTTGAPLMRELWQRMREESGLPYHFTDVFMNAALVGGDVIRSRYFWVAHLRPFGVDLPVARPRSLMEVIGDLPDQAGTRRDPGEDLAWAHVTNASSSDVRVRQTIELFRTKGFDWPEGSRLPDSLKVWAEELGNGYPDWWFGKDGEKLLSHAVSDNMYAPFRWRANSPMGVVTGGFLDRAIHPVAARPFTYREGARFMGLPDDWTLYPYAAFKNDSWLGKGIPVASGRWIAGWAKASIEGDPGEYAGQLVEPGHRVIDVSHPKRVHDIARDQEAPVWWSRRDDSLERTIFVPASAPRPEAPPVVTRPPKPARPLARATERPKGRGPGRPAAGIARIEPEVVLGVIESLGLNRREAAEAIGCSPSRIGEITTRTRPKSWLNADRWPDVQAALILYAGSAVPVG